MKTTVLFFILLFFIVEGFSQQTDEYQNSSLFKKEGVIFTKDYKPRFKTPAGAVIFTPHKADIALAEKILKDNFDQEIGWGRKKLSMDKIFKNYNRQYMGFLLPSGETLIIINLLNFKCRRKAKEMFHGWEESFIIGHGSYYEQNSIIISVYLNQQRLVLGIN